MKLYLAVRYGNTLTNNANDEDTLVLVKADSVERAKELAETRLTRENLEGIISNNCSIIKEISDINKDNEEGIVYGFIGFPHSFNIIGNGTHYFD